MNNLRFNGIKKDYILVLRKKRLPWAALKRNILTIPGKPGGFLQSTDVDPLVISVEIEISCKEGLNLQKTKEDFADWLVTEEVKELIFDDELDRIYYAVVDGSFDMDEIFSFGTGTLNFICPEPYKYGEERFEIFPDELIILQNEGTAETYPVFRATVKESITFLDVISSEGYMRLGEPVDLDGEVPINREERKFWNQGNSLTGWTTGGPVDGGVVAGTLTTDGTRFVASSYGTGTTWHGPAMKTSIPGGPLTDFRVDALITMGNAEAHQVGRVEIYLLDASNNVIGKLAMKDTTPGSSHAKGEARLGNSSINYFMIEESGDAAGAWNNFYGMLRFQRVGNEWEAYIAKVDAATGQHNTRRRVTYIDADNVFNKDLAQIQVHVARYGANLSGTLAVTDLKVFKINQLTEAQIPYIAHDGDIIEYDHSKSLYTINGEDRKDIKDFGARPFPLKRGENIIQASPYSSLYQMEVEWRPRYK